MILKNTVDSYRLFSYKEIALFISIILYSKSTKRLIVKLFSAAVLISNRGGIYIST